MWLMSYIRIKLLFIFSNVSFSANAFIFTPTFSSLLYAYILKDNHSRHTHISQLSTQTLLPYSFSSPLPNTICHHLISSIHATQQTSLTPAPPHRISPFGVALNAGIHPNLIRSSGNLGVGLALQHNWPHWRRHRRCHEKKEIGKGVAWKEGRDGWENKPTSTGPIGACAADEYFGNFQQWTGRHHLGTARPG